MQTSIFVERIYQQIELELFENIGKLIADNMLIDESGMYHWKAEPLGRMGELNRQQLKVIAKYAKMGEQELVKYINSVADAEIQQIDADLKPAFDANLLQPIKPTDAIYNTLLALERQATNTVNLMNASMLNGSEQVYRDIVTQATADVVTGRATLQQSVTRTIKQWAEQGMPVLVDKAGRQWSAEGYLSTAIRTTTKNTQNEVQETRFDEYEIDLVETSSHAGSRPSHFPFQGKIYSRSGKSTKYPPLSITGHGDTLTGFATGINCRHRLYGYIEGLSTKRYEPYDKRESERIYKESQKQRYLERQIRRAKKQEAALKAMNAEAEEIIRAKQLVRNRQKTMREFIKATNRSRRYGREQVVIDG